MESIISLKKFNWAVAALFFLLFISHPAAGDMQSKYDGGPDAYENDNTFLQATPIVINLNDMKRQGSGAFRWYADFVIRDIKYGLLLKSIGVEIE